MATQENLKNVIIRLATKEEMPQLMATEENVATDLKVIGYLVYNNHNEEELKKFFPTHKSGSGLCLDGTGVLPACKKSGVFAQMYSWLYEYAKSNGYSVFFGTVDPTNVPSIMAAFTSAIAHGSSIEFTSPVIEYHMKDGRILRRIFFRIKCAQGN